MAAASKDKVAVEEKMTEIKKTNKDLNAAIAFLDFGSKKAEDYGKALDS